MIEKAYRKLVIPGFEAGLKRRKTFQHWHDLEQSQWWTPDRLQEMQLQRLRDLLDYCSQNSAWYRDLWADRGLDVRAIRSLDDLKNLPITSRDVMRDHAAKIRSSDTRMPFVTKSTGGSSGKPLQFVIDGDANDRRVAATFRGYAWAGAAPGTKQAHLWGINLGQATWRHRLKERLYARYLYRRDMLNSFELSESNVEDYVERLNRFRPAVLVAYTNPLFVLARSIEERAIEVHRPTSIIVGSEKLHDFQRQQIERAFGAPVYETYGSREFTLIGAECDQHCGLHLSSENMIVEVVDDQGNPAAAGEEGQVLITDLFNIAMPFVRYAIGDRAVAGFEQCACGRGLPLIKKILGRQMDVLKLPDGRNLPGIFFPHLLKDIPEIRQFQVVQSSPKKINLKLVVKDGWSIADNDTLRRQIQSKIGNASQLTIETVEKIQLTAAGKMQVVIGFDPMVCGDVAKTRIAG